LTVTIVTPPTATSALTTPLMTEHKLGDYPEFQAFFRRGFDLDTVGLSQPGCVRAESGRLYLLVFLGRSGEAFPSGVEIHPLANGTAIVDVETADRDLSAILQWTIEGSKSDWQPVTTAKRRAKARG
jgi:hypothetical protein